MQWPQPFQPPKIPCHFFWFSGPIQSSLDWDRSTRCWSVAIVTPTQPTQPTQPNPTQPTQPATKTSSLLIVIDPLHSSSCAARGMFHSQLLPPLKGPTKDPKWIPNGSDGSGSIHVPPWRFTNNPITLMQHSVTAVRNPLINNLLVNNPLLTRWLITQPLTSQPKS